MYFMLARMVRRVRRETGASRVGLLGYCMGGTLSAIYTAQHPDEIAALVNYLRTAFAGAKEEVSPEAVAALRQSPLSPAEVLKRRP